MKEGFEKIKERLKKEELTSADAKAEAIIGMQGASANYYGGELRAFGRAIQIVSEVEAEYGKDINVLGNGWISCSERLPEKCGAYLVSYKNTNCIPCATVFDGVQFLDKHVIAWMPLPEPYKPEKGAQDGR